MIPADLASPASSSSSISSSPLASSSSSSSSPFRSCIKGSACGPPDDLWFSKIPGGGAGARIYNELESMIIIAILMQLGNIIQRDYIYGLFYEWLKHILSNILSI